MFGLSLPPVVCRRAHVLLCFFCVCLRIVMMSYHNVFKFWVPCCNINVHYDFRIKKSSIHLYFQLFVGRLIYLCPTLLTMRVTWRVSYKTQKLLDLHGRLGSPRGFGGVRVPYLFIIFFCIVFFFVCLRPVSCIPNAVSFAGMSILDCPFGFFNFYFILYKNHPPSSQCFETDMIYQIYLYLKHWLLSGWYPRGLIHHQQWYRPSDCNKNVDIKFIAHDMFLE
jgi:hypothetical protein